MNSGKRKALNDRRFTFLDVKEQCALLALSRSTFYYRPVSASQQDLVAMRKLDELYQKDPTRGTRRMSHEPIMAGLPVGRENPSSDAVHADEDYLLSSSNNCLLISQVQVSALVEESQNRSL